MSVKSDGPHMVDVYVGNQIRINRISRNMTQMDVAEMLGVSFQQLQKYETGKNRVSASKLYLIARVFDVPVSVFFPSGKNSNPSFDPVAITDADLRLATNIRRLPDHKKRAIQTLMKALNETDPVH